MQNKVENKERRLVIGTADVFNRLWGSKPRRKTNAGRKEWGILVKLGGQG